MFTYVFLWMNESEREEDCKKGSVSEIKKLK